MKKRVNIPQLFLEVEQLVDAHTLKIAQLIDPYLIKSDSTHQDKIIRGTSIKIVDAFLKTIPEKQTFWEVK